ncbi:protein of unknown function [Desulfuromusa kysingii]|uniref:LarA-like N-terminal domain-containing protein n=1 Tax=Desulfuromusa kysingii TaxID=37625 RepID=A0A1H4CS38_9BACT|nr:lactate racemase domain-containing protein [Desulfuromusa kysingii]SEA63171.1 protein of unknown function [Desulfuromusa kysingii]
MDNMDYLLKDIPVPEVVKVNQELCAEHITDIHGEILKKLEKSAGYQKLKSGQTVAVTAGSRGICSIDTITKIIIDQLKQKSTCPFIVPAMGSHGGATAPGQRKVLETLGITEETMGAEIRASMDVVQLGNIADGRPVFLDQHADGADGIVLINRVKAHTSFRGPYESGLMKMMAIGLGKQQGAQAYHKTGFSTMPGIIEAAGKAVLAKKNILFGVAIVENGYGQIAAIEILESDEIIEKEKQLLMTANSYLPKLFMQQLDVLIVKEIGKNISGTGMDSNVTGRFNNEFFTGDIKVSKLAILDLADKSKGNANGVGLADFITEKMYKKIDLAQTYPNALTATTVVSVKIPMTLKNDRQVIQAAIKTANIMDEKNVRLAIIESTKNMKTFYISTNLLDEAASASVKKIGQPIPVPFDDKGDLQLDFH